MGEDCRGCDYLLCIGRCLSVDMGGKMNSLSGKIWGVLASIFAIIAYGLKLRGDHYKEVSEGKDEQIQANDARASKEVYEAINAQKATQAKENLNEETKHNSNGTHHTSIRGV